MLRAAEVFSRSCPAWRLYIAGNGADQASLEAFVQAQDPGQANVLDGGLLTNYMANSFVTSPGEGAGVVDTTASSSAQDFLTRPAA